jgi:histidine kinase
MLKSLITLRHSLITKLVLAVGITLLVSISAWSYLNIRYQNTTVMENLVNSADRLSTTIKLGTHYAMMINSRDDIQRIINNISKQPDIEHIRIYNKEGQIKYSDNENEIDRKTNIRAEACIECHRTDPPLTELALSQRTRIYTSAQGYRSVAILSPIDNEPGCTEPCHVHPEDKKILGALDVSMSLEKPAAEMAVFTRRAYGATVLVILVASTAIIFTILVFVRRPMSRLIASTREIAHGENFTPIELHQDDEMAELAKAINKMGAEIVEKQHELNQQRDEYQNLFETVPCIITVQDRKFKLLQYNREFSDRFKPEAGDYCFHAYKGREEKCPDCPVEKTFETGEPVRSEESGVTRDGTKYHWVVHTSPIMDDAGRVVAAMEMCLDITHRKKLEEELEKSEKKYYAIFNNIPNPVFVLDMDNLKILDCNESVHAVYGYPKHEVIDRPFLDLFVESERDHYSGLLRQNEVMDRVRHLTKDGVQIYVNIRVSPSEYPGQRVLLVTTSDITERLEAEQQLIQAGKMATLGEMATGVAHELNQPLSVIKTASNFFMKKVDKKEPIESDILYSLSEEIDAHVDRATKIINHMREFGRKSDLTQERVQVNQVLKKAFDLFSQQLKLREIEVVWDIQDNLPEVLADPGRMEQVFINLLINARDAIEAQWEQKPRTGGKRIVLESKLEDGRVVVRVHDNGTGIPNALAAKIFEPFFTTKDVGKGTGLGLSISYGFVQDCGGDISAVSNESGGATFILELPAAEEIA